MTDNHRADRTTPARTGRVPAAALIKGVVGVTFLMLLPQLFSHYYLVASTSTVIYAIVALGLGVLVGRVGLVSLGQVAIMVIGAWVTARILFATPLPHMAVLLLAGVATMVIGTLVGLPALRMNGIYLALISLMLSGAIITVITMTNFPNGGSGFLGYDAAQTHIPPIRRPEFASSDEAYFRYAALIALAMFALVWAHIRSKPGRAWAALRQSESAALAAGINTTIYKLWALALASFVTGVAGGLLASSSRYLYSLDFQTQDSIVLLAVALMGGVYNLWGAVIAGLFIAMMPAALDSWGVSSNWLLVVFGVGLLQVLTTAPAGIADQLPKDIARLFRRLSPKRTSPRGAAA